MEDNVSGGFCSAKPSISTVSSVKQVLQVQARTQRFLIKSEIRVQRLVLLFRLHMQMK